MKRQLKANFIDLKLLSHQELRLELARRLKLQRLALKIKQTDLAGRAGVAEGTIKNLEAKGQSSLETFVRVIMALGLTKELESLFVLKIQSIAEFERANEGQNLSRRVR